MTSAQLVNLQGKNVGEVNLNDDVFGITPNTALLFDALQRQLANARSGSAKTKTRSEVSGGGRKPWRQKGTGRARAGSNRSPLWAGGGVIFGPKPRDYSTSMPQKARRLALQSALAAKKDALVIVKDFSELKEAKTKEIAQTIKALGLKNKKVLLVLDFACETCGVVERAAANIDRLKVIHINNLNVKDLLDCEMVLTTERTINAINDKFATNYAESAKEKKFSKDTQTAKATVAEKAKIKPAKKAEAKSVKQNISGSPAKQASKTPQKMEERA